MHVNELPEDVLELIFKSVVDVWPFAIWMRDDQCRACTRRGPVPMMYSTRTGPRNPSCAGCAQARVRSSNRRLGWVNLTFVSSHWRNIIVARPSFWTYIYDPMPLDCTKAFLKRSQSLGIKLQDMHLWFHDTRLGQIPISTGRSPAFLRTLQSAFDRISDLSININTIHIIGPEVASRPLSSLETLDVSAHQRHSVWPLLNSPVTTGKTDIATSLGAHCLKRLTVSCCLDSVDWTLSIYANLRMISLSDLRVPPGVLPALLASLRSLRFLETLQLIHLSELESDIAQELESEIPVVVRSCKELYLEGEKGFIMSFLNILRLPSPALVRTRVRFMTSATPRSSEAFFAQLSRASYVIDDDKPSPDVAWASFHHHRASSANPIKLLTPVQIVRDTWTMRLSHKAPSPKPTRLLGTDYDRELQVLWSNDLRGGYNDHAFLDDCTAAFTSVASAARTIRELRFAARTHYAPISPLFLRHCFSSWTSVERIYAEGTIAAHCLVSALEAVPRGMEPLFPRLNELILIDAHFEQDGLGAKGALGAQLLGMLAERRDAGFALKTLRLSDVEALRRETMWWNLISDMVSVIPLHA